MLGNKPDEETNRRLWKEEVKLAVIAS